MMISRLKVMLAPIGGLAVMAVLLSCASEASERGMAEAYDGDKPMHETAVEVTQQMDKAKPDTIGSALWRHLQDANYRANWELWPGKGELYKGQEPHGMLLTTYLNPLAHDALTNKAGKFSPGAIIVKENYAPDSSLAATTVMYKAAGYDPAHGDWFWVKYTSLGTVDMEGKAQGRVGTCIECHGAKMDNDYIFTGSLK